jgi:hypothetical protein
MSNIGGSSTPAGWYGDPAGSGQLRWWDGAAWTAHLAPIPSPQPAPTPTPVAHSSTVAQAPAVIPAVEPIERPYVPFQNSWNTSTGQYGPVQEIARPMRSSTVGVWLLATSYFWISVIGFIAGVISALVLGGQSVEINGQLTSSGVILEVTVWVVAWILMIIAGARDNVRLRQLGYLSSTSPAWLLLLPPLVYLIIRTVRVRSESGRGAAPLVFYLVSGAILSVLAVLTVVVGLSLVGLGGANSAVTKTANATSLAAGITDGLDKSGGSYRVTCTPFAQPTTTSSDVTCTATDQSTQASHTLLIEIDPGTAGGKPTVRLLSVTPPIAQ